MFGFSLALALPFSLFSFFPGWLQSLPKSGGWMDDVKVTLGFLEIALAFKFLSVADLTMGWKIVPYELFIVVWVLCALGLALYFLGKLRFPHTPRRASIGTTRWVLTVVSLVLAGYFASGFRVREGAKGFITPNLLSGVAPPAGHSYIFPRHCPMDLDCYNDYEEGVAVAKAQNKPILLDFTGHGCVNCRRMEDNVWSKENVYKMIKNDYVLISLYADARKALKEPIVLPNRTLRNEGNKWAWFQETYFDRVSQPYYVLLSPNHKFLNQPVAYTPEVKEYEAFLRCGLERFNKQKAAAQ
jgi:thiol:disulfide interchange protein DsbD